MKAALASLVTAGVLAIGGFGMAAPAAAAVPAKKFTMKQVGRHASSADCWAVINGKVYNLTSWISRHPGGSGRILAICGRDGSAAFDAQHSGSGNALAVLATFKIGRLR